MFADLLTRRIGSLIELTPVQFEKLEGHFNLLNRWNKKLNLTAIREVEAIVERHYCESLFLGKHLPPGSFRIADVGSGAGFPGIPLAIQRPGSSVALIEAHQRKCVFLMEASRNLDNVWVIPRRAEDVTETFDWAVSRGVNSAEISKAIRKLAVNVALLAGEDNPNRDFTWNKIKLPWGEHRFLWIGRST